MRVLYSPHEIANRRRQYGRHVCLACCAELYVNVCKCNLCTRCADNRYAALRTYSRGVWSTEHKLPTLANTANRTAKSEISNAFRYQFWGLQSNETFLLAARFLVYRNLYER